MTYYDRVAYTSIRLKKLNGFLELRRESRVRRHRVKMKYLLGLLAGFKNPSKAFICGIKRHIRAMS